MNNIRLQARNAIIRAERGQDPVWNPFLKGRRWMRHAAVEGDMEDGQVMRHEILSEAPVEHNESCMDGSAREEQKTMSPIIRVSSDPRDNRERAHSTGDCNDDCEADLRADSTAPSVEQMARRRFVNKFRKSKQDSPSKSSEMSKEKLKNRPLTFANQALAIFCSWLSILLPFVPAGFVAEYANLPPLTNFILNFLAIFPIASIVGMAMDELILRVGNTLGVLIYMSFGNIVQLVTSILLLRTRQVAILQTSLIGGVLGGLLLITGASFLAGGLQRSQQFFNITTASYIANFLTLSVASLIVPTASHLFTDSTTKQIAGQSRGTSVVLLLVYGFYLMFQLKTHTEIFGLENGNRKIKKIAKRLRKNNVPVSTVANNSVAAGENFEAHAQPPSFNSESSNVEPQLHWSTAVITLIAGTTLLAFNTSFAVDSIDGLTQNHASQSFVGLILLPFLNNDLMPIKCARMDKVDLSIMASAGKSLQTSLLITPLIVIIAWVWGIDDMGLLFDGFQVASLFVSVLLFRFQIMDGTSNYLQGVLLLSVYIIIAIAAWYN